MNCGIIGCGRNVEDLHMPAIKAIKDLRLEAVCDTSQERLEQFSMQYDVPNSYYELDEFLNSSSSLDFVVISTPGFTHYEIARKLLSKKGNLLIEKPITLTFDQVLHLKELADSTGSRVGVIQNYRYRDPVIKAKEAQSKGVIGDVTQINVVFHGHPIYSEPASWSWDERTNKTLLYEMMIHFLDLQVYFAGPVQRVLACHTKVDEILDVTTNIYALVEHKSKAVGIIDLQLFASSNYLQFEVFGTANDVTIKFQPHYLRIYSGTLNPIDELLLDGKRILDFGLEALLDRIQPMRVNRRAVSHYRVFSLFVESIRKSKPFPIDITQIIPTMEYAQMLSDLVYQF